MDEQSLPEQQRQPTYYQTAVLTPDLVSTLVVDDSPDILFDRFWAFFGVDIPVAMIMPWDFQNILDFVDISVYDYMQDWPESEWENVAIVQYEERDVNGERKMVAVRAYKIIETWNTIRAKMYMKMCRAREGFTLRQLTESKSFVEERLHNMSPMNMQGVPQMQEQGKSRWKLW